MPLIMSRAIGEPAMLYGDTLAKSGPEPACNHWGQPDLGHQNQRLATHVHSSAGQLQIDLDGSSSVSMASEGASAPVVEVETRVSVVGRVWSIDAYPNGVDVNRWSITLMDKDKHIFLIL